MIHHGLTTKHDGNMLLAIGDEILEEPKKNRAAFLQQRGLSHDATCRLVHGTDVRQVSMDDDHEIVWGVDALITTEPNLTIVLTVADCLPIFFWNEHKGVIALAHAGWRGIVGGIIPHVVEKFQTMSVQSNELSVAIGPGIHACHFEIHNDVLSNFSNHQKYIEKRDDNMFVDLPGIIREQLLDLGVPASSITTSDECTYCLSEKYFSFRRDGSGTICHEAMMAYIARTA